MMDGIFTNNNCSKVLQDIYLQVTLDGHQCLPAVGLFYKKIKNYWTAGDLCRHIIMCQIRARLKQAEAMKISKIQNISSVLVLQDFVLVDMTKAFVDNAGAL